MNQLALQLIAENQRTQAPTLNLARCGLTELPPALFDCTHLETLILSNRCWNPHSGRWELQRDSGPFNRLMHLPAAIKRLHKLKRLEVGGSRTNWLSGMDDSWGIGNTDLQQLASLKSLRQLNLAYTSITDLSALSGLVQLQELDLSETHIQCRKSKKMVRVRTLIDEVFESQSGFASFTSPQLMKRSEYLRDLLKQHQLGEALEEMSRLTAGGRLDSTAILLCSRYNRLKAEAGKGIIEEAQRQLQSNRLLQGALSLLEQLKTEYPQQMEEEVARPRHPLPPDPVMQPVSSRPEGPSYHFHGPVGSVNPHNQGEITQHIDQRDQRGWQQHLEPMQQLVEAGHQLHYLSREEYEELLDILEEMREEKAPTEKQQRKWKRWLGKALQAGQQIVAGRLEKGADTLISESLKTWLKEGGMQTARQLLDTLF